MLFREGGVEKFYPFDWYDLNTLFQIYWGILIIKRERKRKSVLFRQCNSTQMLGGLRNQFTLPESVEAGLYAGDFLRLMQLNRSVPNDLDVRCHFNKFSIDQSMINDLQQLDPKFGLLWQRWNCQIKK